MSTREREVVDVGDVHPSTSLALVPLARDRTPLQPATPASSLPAHLHRWFYGLGYASLVGILLGGWFEHVDGDLSDVFYAMGLLGLAPAGLGVLIHVAYRPSERKLRMGLGAVASLVIAVSATIPLGRISQEVHAQNWIVRLQPLADDLVRDGRIASLSFTPDGWVEYDGRGGRLDNVVAEGENGTPVLMADLLREGGVAPQEMERLRARAAVGGASLVEVRDGYVSFQSRLGILTYVAPGRVPPPPATPIMEVPRPWRLPLGGGWSLLR